VRSPVPPARVIWGVGLNYRDHAAETGRPLPEAPTLFVKSPSAVIGLGAPIVVPPHVTQPDYEGELAVVIGRLAHRLSPQDAVLAILGYTCGNDVTLRDLQARDGQWTRAKGFDTSCPLGPWIETDVDPADLELTTRVNGEVRQQARTSDLTFGPAGLVAFVSTFMTLLPGDVIMTGTPAGIGPLQPGDRVEVEIEGIGSLQNPVVAA
jgi:2-keto-4-pentenoate hydratase/2-oxohepta-3-ene-1,7-dioic acid hydratase in catechol pathway